MKYATVIKKTDISNHNLQFYLDGMKEESGEISGVFKRVRRGDFGEIAKKLIDTPDGIRKILKKFPKIKEAVLQEMGDEHWYETRFLSEIGSSWNQVERLNGKKVKRRKKEGTTMGEGSNR